MMSTALACAALLMGVAVPNLHITVVAVEEISSAVCAGRWDGQCAALYASTGRASGVVVTTKPNNFPLAVHEMVHALQAYYGREWNSPAGEREAHRIQARVGECDG